MFDKIRVGQKVLTGKCLLREMVVFRIDEEHDGSLSYSCKGGDKLIKLNRADVFSIVSGPTEPKTLDENKWVNVDGAEDSAATTFPFKVGEEISFKTLYEGTEIEINGYVLVSGRDCSLCSEMGVSVPKAWRVHNSLIQPRG